MISPLTHRIRIHADSRDRMSTARYSSRARVYETRHDPKTTHRTDNGGTSASSAKSIPPTEETENPIPIRFTTRDLLKGDFPGYD